MPLFIKYVFVNYNEFSSEKKKSFPRGKMTLIGSYGLFVYISHFINSLRLSGPCTGNHCNLAIQP